MLWERVPIKKQQFDYNLMTVMFLIVAIDVIIAAFSTLITNESDWLKQGKSFLQHKYNNIK